MPKPGKDWVHGCAHELRDMQLRGYRRSWSTKCLKNNLEHQSSNFYTAGSIFTMT